MAEWKPPALGDIVRYIGKYGTNAPRAAIVTCTKADVVPFGDVAGLTSPMNVHLTVFTPSLQPPWAEFDVPYDEDESPGTWSWPSREGS